MTHRDDHCDELLGAYVLGACPEAEAAEVAEHLAGCARCAIAAQRLREGADVLLARVAPIAPPPDVRERVMAPVRAEAALFEAARVGAHEAGMSDGGRSMPSRRPLPRTRMSARVPAAAAAAVLILIAAGAGLLSSGLGSGAAKRDVVVAQVQATQPRGASASLEIRGERAQLRVRGLRNPGDGRVYQVWVRRDRQVPEPAGALRVDARGTARARLSADIHRVDQVLVTSEPAGGSVLPTRVPVLEVDTSA